MRQSFDLLGGALALVVSGVIGAFVLAATLGGGLHYRSICWQQTGPDTAVVDESDWNFHLLSWFQPLLASYDRSTGETCQNETYTQFVVGKVPIVGNWFEAQIGGPHVDSPYYDQ